MNRLGFNVCRDGDGGVGTHGRGHEEALADRPARHVLERARNLPDGLGVYLCPSRRKHGSLLIRRGK